MREGLVIRRITIGTSFDRYLYEAMADKNVDRGDEVHRITSLRNKPHAERHDDLR